MRDTTWRSRFGRNRSDGVERGAPRNDTRAALARGALRARQSLSGCVSAGLTSKFKQNEPEFENVSNSKVVSHEKFYNFG